MGRSTRDNVATLKREEEAYLASLSSSSIIEREQKESESLDGIISDSGADPDDTSPAKADKKPRKKRVSK